MDEDVIIDTDIKRVLRDNMKTETERFDLSGRTVAVVGLGKSGQAALSVLLQGKAGNSCRVIVSESRSDGVLESLPGELRRGVAAIQTGGHTGEFLGQADFIILSPGVPITAPAVVSAKKSGVPVVSEMEFGYRLIGCPVVAITGTNGKTTTTNLTGEMFSRAGYKVEVAGNIGRPLSDVVAAGEQPDLVVLEVSSFQLEAVRQFKANGALILNVTPDHLNRHGTFETYADVKFRVFDRQRPDDVAVLNLDDPVSRDYILACEKLEKPNGDGTVFLFSRYRPVTAGVSVAAGKILFRPHGPGRESVEVAGLDDVRLRGEHNLENVLGAVALGCGLGLSPEPIRKAIRTFEGVVHRLESVAMVGQVEFINDSKATNVASTRCAVKALDKPFIIILGGYDKNADFTELAGDIADLGIRTVLMGDTRFKIATALKKTGHNRMWKVPDLDAAVEKAWEIADNRDCILLSPGCASFDQFSNFEERGNRFKKLVMELKDRFSR